MFAVLGASVASGLITILKFIGVFITGSSGLMAEVFHSLAETTHQAFLLCSGFGFTNARPPKNIRSAKAGSVFSGRLFPPGNGQYRDGIASIIIGIILAIVVFIFARSALRARRRLSTRSRPSAAPWSRILMLLKYFGLLTTHLAPKQILVNANIAFKKE